LRVGYYHIVLFILTYIHINDMNPQVSLGLEVGRLLVTRLRKNHYLSYNKIDILSFLS